MALVSAQSHKVAAEVAEIIRSGGVLLAERVSVGPYNYASGWRGYATITTARHYERKNSRHVAGDFVRQVGWPAAQAAIIRYRETNE